MEIAFIPSTLLRRLDVCRERQWHWNVLFSTIAALAAAPLLLALAHFVPHACLFQALFGIPCPGCGVTRSLVAMLTLAPAAAWRANPAGILVGVFLAAQLLLRPLALRAAVASRSVNTVSRIGGQAVLAALLVVWCGRIFF